MLTQRIESMRRIRETKFVGTGKSMVERLCTESEGEIGKGDSGGGGGVE